jgi:TonB family protein
MALDSRRAIGEEWGRLMNTTLRLTLAAAAISALLASPRASADDILPASSVDRIPEVTHQERPEYPFSLRLTGNRGEVLVDFIVDPQGNVVKADVTKSSHPDFEAPAVEAVLQWKFKPGLKNGHPVYVHMAVPIIFQLTGAADDARFLHPDLRGGGVEPWEVPQRASKEVPPEFQYDEPPSPLLTSAPVYPYDLLLGNVKGKASVAFTIDTLGRTHVVKVISASRPEFAAATTAMIEAWKFEPAKKKGKPCWAVLRKDQEFERDADDFPMNESAERLLTVLRKSPCPIISDFRDLDTPLRGRFMPNPVVPDSLLATTGPIKAVIEFVIDHAGHAQLPHVVSTTNPDFGWAAATAVARWQYTTPTKNGRAVDVRVRVPLVFSPPNLPHSGS